MLIILRENIADEDVWKCKTDVIGDLRICSKYKIL